MSRQGENPSCTVPFLAPLALEGWRGSPDQLQPWPSEDHLSSSPCSPLPTPSQCPECQGVKGMPSWPRPRPCLPGKLHFSAFDLLHWP